MVWRQQGGLGLELRSTPLVWSAFSVYKMRFPTSVWPAPVRHPFATDGTGKDPPVGKPRLSLAGSQTPRLENNASTNTPTPKKQEIVHVRRLTQLLIVWCRH